MLKLYFVVFLACSASYQNIQIFVPDILFLISKYEEPFINFINLFLDQMIAKQ